MPPPPRCDDRTIRSSVVSRRARVDGRRGLRDPFADRRDASGDEQRRAGIEQHDVSRRARSAIEHTADDRRVLGGIAASKIGRRSPSRMPNSAGVDDRTCARRRRDTRTPWCGRSSRSRRCRRRRERPRRASTQAACSARASSSVSSGRGTPTICRVAPAGFVSGPSRLNAVRIPISRRVGRRVLHRRMERRREEERDVRVVQRPLHDRGGAATFTPSCSNTSALPQRLDTDRLPCFATFTPHAATTIAAADEMLNVPDRSPPVPHVSNTSPGGVDSLHRVLAHRPREADDLGRPLAFHHAAPTSSAASAPGAARPSMTSRMAAGGLVGREVLVANELLDELREHHRSRKFRRIFRPSSVSTDSG